VFWVVIGRWVGVQVSADAVAERTVAAAAAGGGDDDGLRRGGRIMVPSHNLDDDDAEAGGAGGGAGGVAGGGAGRGRRKMSAVRSFRPLSTIDETVETRHDDAKRPRLDDAVKVKVEVKVEKPATSGVDSESTAQTSDCQVKKLSDDVQTTSKSSRDVVAMATRQQQQVRDETLTSTQSSADRAEMNGTEERMEKQSWTSKLTGNCVEMRDAAVRSSSQRRDDEISRPPSARSESETAMTSGMPGTSASVDNDRQRSLRSAAAAAVTSRCHGDEPKWSRDTGRHRRAGKFVVPLRRD